MILSIDLEKVSKADGVIFDFNGVLLFDADIQEQVWSILAQKYRGSPLTEHDKRDSIHGKTTKAIFECLLGRPLDEGEVAEKIIEKEEAYREECLRRRDAGAFNLSLGAEELLNYLVEHKIPCTIATSSSHDDLALFIETLGLERWFDRSKIIYNDGTFPGKPNPTIFLRAADAIGLPPEKCLVFEDAISGIEAANTAKIGVICGIGSTIDLEMMRGRITNLIGVAATLADVPRSIFAAGGEHLPLLGRV